MSNHLIALCVGHSRLINGLYEGGAVSVGGVSEHTYNSDLAGAIQTLLAARGIQSIIISRYEGNGYTAAQRWLAETLKSRGVTAAVELHFNDGGNVTATGHEWLYLETSIQGKRLAKSLESAFCAFPLKSRGAKPLNNQSRGAEFVKGTHCPAVICEPFFGSNPTDWKLATEQKGEIVKAIADGIERFVKA